MKKIFFTSVIFLIAHVGWTQNVGIGISDPINKLHVLGNLLVNAPYVSTNTAPTPAQTKTMVAGNTLFFSPTDSTGRIYDPGGPNSNYGNNQTAYVVIEGSFNSSGIEINLEDVELNTGDSLIIAIDNNPVLAVGNGYSTTGKLIINARLIYITFKSNNDGITGRGFSLFFRMLYENTVLQKPLSGFVGKSMFFDTKNGAFRAGGISVGSIGNYSAAWGYYNTASGLYSTALGIGTMATGQSSFAAGQGTLASGLNSIAMGYTSESLGEYSFAFGSFTKAQANNSIALGGNTIASGPNSISIGFNTKAVGFSSFAMGNSTQANGNYSTSSGYNSIATGSSSFAIGNTTSSGGESSVAMGYLTTASGYASTAMGLGTIASGSNSTALGTYTSATGWNSTALGNYVSTSGYSGAFAIGDHSTTTVMESFVNNGFRARFAGGYRLLTNSAATLGVVLLPDGGAWSAISDVRQKENFLPVNGEVFLNKIALLPLTTWNYKAQQSKTSRHYGPMAQDFYKAFGKDELGEIGCDTLINQQDFLGVNLIAIQALEKRTTTLLKENEELKVRLEKLEKLIPNKQ